MASFLELFPVGTGALCLPPCALARPRLGPKFHKGRDGNPAWHEREGMNAPSSVPVQLSTQPCCQVSLQIHHPECHVGPYCRPSCTRLPTSQRTTSHMLLSAPPLPRVPS